MVKTLRTVHQQPLWRIICVTPFLPLVRIICDVTLIFQQWLPSKITVLRSFETSGTA